MLSVLRDKPVVMSRCRQRVVLVDERLAESRRKSQVKFRLDSSLDLFEFICLAR